MTSPYIIAGPCAAETEQQLLQTAYGVQACVREHPHYHYIYRAGIWKPRTSPATFQGIGSDGLHWLKRVQNECGLDIATEVATAEQLYAAIDNHLDYIWIGARTSASPIAVQAIADAISSQIKCKNGCSLKGILIKNPVNEDAALWMGNISRLEQTGLPVIAVHRGCNHHPCWSMAYQLVQQRPDIPLIIDPSHMTGQADAIAQLCVKAQQMSYQGWMIETHVAPCMALSDAQQQITPCDLKQILTTLDAGVIGEPTELDWLRCMIDEVDDELWTTIALRMDICRRIGAWKKQKGIPVFQPTRYQQILQKRIVWGENHDMDQQVVQQIMDAIHKESIRIQS